MKQIKMIEIRIWEDEIKILEKVCEELKAKLKMMPIDVNIGMHDKIIPIPLSKRTSFLYQDDPREKNIKAKITADVLILFKLGIAFQYNVTQKFPNREINQ